MKFCMTYSLECLFDNILYPLCWNTSLNSFNNTESKTHNKKWLLKCCKRTHSYSITFSYYFHILFIFKNISTGAHVWNNPVLISRISSQIWKAVFSKSTHYCRITQFVPGCCSCHFEKRLVFAPWFCDQ